MLSARIHFRIKRSRSLMKLVLWIFRTRWRWFFLLPLVTTRTSFHRCIMQRIVGPYFGGQRIQFLWIGMFIRFGLFLSFNSQLNLSKSGKTMLVFARFQVPSSHCLSWTGIIYCYLRNKYHSAKVLNWWIIVLSAYSQEKRQCKGLVYVEFTPLGRKMNCPYLSVILLARSLP